MWHWNKWQVNAARGNNHSIKQEFVFKQTSQGPRTKSIMLSTNSIVLFFLLLLLESPLRAELYFIRNVPWDGRNDNKEEQCSSVIMCCLLTEAVTLNTDEVMKSSFVSDFFWTLENMQWIIVRKNRKDKRGKYMKNISYFYSVLCLQEELLNINIERYNQPSLTRKKKNLNKLFHHRSQWRDRAGIWGQARLKSSIKKKKETLIQQQVGESTKTNWIFYLHKRNFCYICMQISLTAKENYILIKDKIGEAILENPHTFLRITFLTYVIRSLYSCLVKSRYGSTVSSYWHTCPPRQICWNR